VSDAVGVLALQGDFAPHAAALARLGVQAREVRAPRDLTGLSHLVLPGGESTTLWHLLELFGLRAPLVERHRAGELALFGTCAGAILLGRGGGERPPRLGLLDCQVVRNAYGTQVDSFTRRIALAALGRELDCVFIRAPKIRTVGPGVEVLARDGDDPILVRAPALLAATFHPELTGDSGVHALFLAMDPAAARSPSAAARAG
jgi:5'-phosphate synthase pdxT subunit